MIDHAKKAAASRRWYARNKNRLKADLAFKTRKAEGSRRYYARAQEALKADPAYKARKALNSRRYYTRAKDTLKIDPEYRAMKAASQRRHYRKNIERSRAATRAKHLFRKYGIGMDEFCMLLAKQGGACAICRTATPTDKRCTRLCVDHDHRTGKVRAILCGKCNTLIAWAQEDPALLNSAAEYLKAHITLH